MGKHWAYLRYVLRHKLAVFRAARKLGVPWLGVLHDLSKFDPREFIPYAERFYGRGAVIARGGNGRDATLPLDILRPYQEAWGWHLRRNKHHPDYWVLNTSPDPSVRPHNILPMPERYVREMLADWEGARRAGADGAKPSTRAWYAEHGASLPLHPETRALVERLLPELER